MKDMTEDLDYLEGIPEEERDEEMLHLAIMRRVKDIIMGSDEVDDECD